MAKKKKRARAEAESQPQPQPQNEVELVVNGDSNDNEKTKKKKKKKQKKQTNKADNDHEEEEAKEIPTVTIALAGSIINNAQSLELATRVPLSLPLFISYYLYLFICFLFFSVGWPDCSCRNDFPNRWGLNIMHFFFLSNLFVFWIALKEMIQLLLLFV